MKIIACLLLLAVAETTASNIFGINLPTIPGVGDLNIGIGDKGVNVGVGSIVNVTAGSDGVNVGVEAGPVKVDVGAGGDQGVKVGVGVGDAGVNVGVGKDGVNVGVAGGGVNVSVGAGGSQGVNVGVGVGNASVNVGVNNQSVNVGINPGNGQILNSTFPIPSSPPTQDCYVDKLLDRDLPFQVLTGAFTIAQCNAKCANFKFYGLQNGNQCFCGDAVGRFGAGGGCTTACQGQAGAVCGGFLRNLASAVTKPATPQYPLYLGCYKDKLIPRQLPTERSSAAMTLAKCAAACQGFKYIGLQLGNQCFCGNGAYSSLGATSECSSACGGEPNLICGGWFANSVFALTA